MDSPEQPDAIPALPEQQTALEKLQREEADALLEFASSRLPKMKPRRGRIMAKLITLFALASTLALKEHEPNTPAYPESAELTALVGKNLEQPVSPTELDTLTKEMIKSVIDYRDTKGVGDLIYGNISVTDEKNDSASDTEHLRGELPERAKKVILRGGSITMINEGQTNNVVSIEDSHRRVIALSGIAQGFDVMPVGKEMELTGFGTTEKTALESALEDAVGFFGREVGVEQSLQSTTVDTGKESTTRVVENFDRDIRSRSGGALYSYELSSRKQRPDGMWEVIVRVQLGRVAETEEPEQEIIAKIPKD